MAADKEQWLDRERIEGVRVNIGNIHALLDTVSHSVAEAIIRQLNDIDAAVTDDLDAAVTDDLDEILGRCEHCGEIVCLDDHGYIIDDVLACAACVARWNEPAA